MNKKRLLTKIKAIYKMANELKSYAPNPDYFEGQKHVCVQICYEIMTQKERVGMYKFFNDK